MEECEGLIWSNYAVHIIYMYANAISGSLSIIGSLIIIFILVRGGQTRLSRLHNRLLLGCSSIDVLYSFAMGLSFIPSPKINKCSYGLGNASSCNAQGFFLTLGLAVPGYIAMLSIYYLATVVYSKTENMIAQRFELLMHAYAVLPALVCASIGASKSYFFSQVGQCWIEDPCRSSMECTGWDSFGKGGWLVLASMMWVGINCLVTFYCIVNIYCEINRRAIATRWHTISNAPPSNMELTVVEYVKQGLLYMCAFLFTYSWSGIALVAQSIGLEASSQILYILTAVFLPLQGFWNFLAYIRPRFMKLRRENKSLSFLTILKFIIITEDDPASNHRSRQQRFRFDSLDINTTLLPNIDIERSDAD